MKKKYILILMLLIPIEVFATSGRLKSESITSCNGQTYGQHGDGHWHLATSNNGIWYADGEPLGYSSPCQSVQEQPATPPQTNEPIINEQNSNNSNTINQENVQQNNPTKSSNKNAKILYQEAYLVFDSNNVATLETSKKEISFKIELEDEKATSNLKDSYEIIDDETIIDIIVTAEDESTMTYKINVNKKDEKKVIVKQNTNKNKKNENDKDTNYNIFTILATFGIIFCWAIIIKVLLCKDKKKRKIMFLCGLLGWIGIHRFANKNIKIGIVYILTLGLFGFGWVFDEVLILTNKFKYNTN